MLTKNSKSVAENWWPLAGRVASSRYFSKSARLRDMFLYLCGRVLDESADDIHEHEVGHKVFGRPLDYDTDADNIVRVNASTLRKRIDQYFANEGRDEPFIVEIPKGNYAPIFRERPASPQPEPVPEGPRAELRPDWRIALLVALAAIFACSTAYLLFRVRHAAQVSASLSAVPPKVRQFWSQVFSPGKTTDVVLDDATLEILQEFTSDQVPLSEYFDRSYLQSVENKSIAARLDRDFAASLLLRRQSSFADVGLLWKLAQTATALQGEGKIQFARDYAFREVKIDDVILLGNSRSNPWIESFENHLALRWNFDNSSGGYYPVDTASSDREKFHIAAQAGEPREGYATLSLLPNLNGTGKVLIISGTGGAAMSAALDFLLDERSVSQLHSLLSGDKSPDFPNFEALLKVKSQSNLSRATTIVICRRLQP